MVYEISAPKKSASGVKFVRVQLADTLNTCQVTKPYIYIYMYKNLIPFLR